MGKIVEVIITGKNVGTVQVIPYSMAMGLAVYPGSTVAKADPVLYKVPRYEVRMGGGAYEAVRFGLQNKGIFPPAERLFCDAGLSMAQVCTPDWLPGYSPRTFRGGPNQGAWVLIPGRSFLIHEGADTTQGENGGSLGCIEILDGLWPDFLRELQILGGGTCAEIGRQKSLKVTLEQA